MPILIPRAPSCHFRLSHLLYLLRKIIYKNSSVRKSPFQVFIDYVIQIKRQQMSHVQHLIVIFVKSKSSTPGTCKVKREVRRNSGGGERFKICDVMMVSTWASEATLRINNTNNQTTYYNNMDGNVIQSQWDWHSNSETGDGHSEHVIGQETPTHCIHIRSGWSRCVNFRSARLQCSYSCSEISADMAGL